MVKHVKDVRELGRRITDGGMAALVQSAFAVSRGLGPKRASDVGGFLTRALGPLLPQQKIALDNVRSAFPEKSESEVQRIVSGAWENLGRNAAEYAHLNQLIDFDESRPGHRTELVGLENIRAMRDDGKPGLIFAAHLANWELTGVAVFRLGLNLTAVFRPPNNAAVGRVVHQARRGSMGDLTATGRGAVFALKRALDRGAHLGVLIDQHFTRGIQVSFLGRPALTNPVLAKLARLYDCPVHGCRAVRLGDNRFKIEMTDELQLPRDADGRINVQGATQAITDVIGGWIREHPDQWLWMHRRWRVPVGTPGAELRSSEPSQEPKIARRSAHVVETRTCELARREVSSKGVIP